MHDPREFSQTLVINGEAGAVLAGPRVVMSTEGAALFFCGAGALDTLVKHPAFLPAVEAGTPVVIVFSDPHEAFELGARVTKYKRTKTIDMLKRVA
jgi:hypothetical protein